MSLESNGPSYSFTCVSCRVAFVSLDIQKQHYKTDWHRYNLKRKIVNLPPVTAEEFQQRVLEQREKEANDSKDTSTYCKACHKKYCGDKAFDNHVNSKKHKDAVDAYAASNNIVGSVTVADISSPVVKKEKLIIGNQSETSEMEVTEEASDVEEIDSDEWEDEEMDVVIVDGEENPILKNNCLFCTHHSANMLKNLKHMSVEHSFFIPDVEFVVNLRALLLYLGEKVCTNYICLWCNSGFHSFEGIQMHMRDKGHCKMLHEEGTLLEYEGFYDYSKSYPDDGDAVDKDEEIIIPDLDTEDYQLTLPSGATIGHRDLLPYYKQHYSANQDKSVDLIKKRKLNKVISTYRALGWKESDKQIVARKVRDIRYMKNVQWKLYTKLGVKANKFQTHFRPQVIF